MIGTLVKSLGKQLQVVRKCSMRHIYVNGLGNGEYLHRYLSHLTDYQRAFTQVGSCKQDGTSYRGQTSSSLDYPMHSWTQREPSLSQVEISCFHYWISKCLASEAHLASLMISQQNQLPKLGHDSYFEFRPVWRGQQCLLIEMNIYSRFGLSFSDFETLSVTTIWGLIEWQTHPYCILQSVASDKRACSWSRKYNNWLIIMEFTDFTILFQIPETAGLKKVKNSLLVVKLRY